MILSGCYASTTLESKIQIQKYSYQRALSSYHRAQDVANKAAKKGSPVPAGSLPKEPSKFASDLKLAGMRCGYIVTIPFDLVTIPIQLPIFILVILPNASRPS